MSRDLLATYPAKLRDAILQQRADLMARQRSGSQDVGPWAPAVTVKARKAKRKRSGANVLRIRRTA